MKTYLIARAKIQDRDFKKGIDSIVNIAYMGASEYEWGALPESLESIRSKIDSYTYLDVPIKDVIVTVFCQEDKKSEVKQYLTELADGTMRTKNGNYFDWYCRYSVDDSLLHVRKTVDFWWDCQNHLMFWIKNNDFEVKFKEIIKVTPQKD